MAIGLTIAPGILTDRSKGYRNDPEWERNEDVRLNPESIAKVSLSSNAVEACRLTSLV